MILVKKARLLDKQRYKNTREICHTGFCPHADSSVDTVSDKNSVTIFRAKVVKLRIGGFYVGLKGRQTEGAIIKGIRNEGGKCAGQYGVSKKPAGN